MHRWLLFRFTCNSGTNPRASGTISHPCKKQSDKAACKCRSCDNDVTDSLEQAPAVSLPNLPQHLNSTMLKAVAELFPPRSAPDQRISADPNSGSQPSAPGSSID